MSRPGQADPRSISVAAETGSSPEQVDRIHRIEGCRKCSYSVSQPNWRKHSPIVFLLPQPHAGRVRTIAVNLPAQGGHRRWAELRWQLYLIPQMACLIWMTMRLGHEVRFQLHFHVPSSPPFIGLVETVALYAQTISALFSTIGLAAFAPSLRYLQCFIGVWIFIYSPLVFSSEDGIDLRIRLLLFVTTVTTSVSAAVLSFTVYKPLFAGRPGHWKRRSGAIIFSMGGAMMLNALTFFSSYALGFSLLHLGFAFAMMLLGIVVAFYRRPSVYQETEHGL